MFKLNFIFNQSLLKLIILSLGLNTILQNQDFFYIGVQNGRVIKQRNGEDVEWRRREKQIN